jgi:FkbM family methyltransferase
MQDTDFWMPGWEDATKTVLGTGNGQKGLRDRALQYVTHWRTCVDVGACVGMWTRFLQRDFDQVVCFEPNPAFTRCWHRNILPDSNAVLHEVGLSDTDHTAYYPEGQPQSLARDDVPGNIQLRTLDSFELHDVDFVKIDVDGYEDRVLMGAERTILRCTPVINIEMKRARRPHICKSSADTLTRLGYSRQERNKSDEVWCVR